MTEILKYAFSLLPVLLYLLMLIYLDSYKLTGINNVMLNIAVGVCAAMVSLFANSALISIIDISQSSFSRYVAPLVEELIKSVYVIYLIRNRRVGFMVDIAIYGFAIGAGFSLFENLYYIFNYNNSVLGLWIVRGFGTAAIHGTTTAIFGMIVKSYVDRGHRLTLNIIMTGYLFAATTHSLFNHLIRYPLATTISVLVFLPLLMVAIFNYSEKALHNWLGEGMDTDIDMLEILTTEKISESRIGSYLSKLRRDFSGDKIVDMLGFLRMHTELSLRAKGLLMAAQSGIKIDYDRELDEKFEELKFLQKSIGKTGFLAIHPFLRMSNRDLWQLYKLKH